MSESPAWRAALLGTVAAGSLWLYSARTARADPDACSITGTPPNQIATCQGNQSQGISSAGADDFDPADVETLNVNNLTTDIAPGTYIPGIFFSRTGAGENVVINSDTTDGPNGAKQIIVNGILADGIYANSAYGTVTIDHRGDVRSYGGKGIAGRAVGDDGTVDIIARGNIFSTRNGIYANAGLAVTVDSIGDITTADFNGIGAVSLQSTVDIISVGTIKSGGDGIYANAALAVTIDSTGDIISYTGRGIDARSSGAVDGKSISITTDGKVTGDDYGIYARNQGTGALEIVANGDVVGTVGTGIYAKNYGVNADGMSLSISTEGVTGGQFGIDARNHGTGALEIVANGDVEGTAADSIGIYAITYSTTPNTDLSITTGVGTTVTGDYRGIVAHHNGNEDLIITANGDVIGTTDTAIYARSTIRGNDVSVTTRRGTSVTGGVFGIDARTSSTGMLEIIARGDVEGTTGTGIYARQSNAAASGAVSITAEGNVTGGQRGIDARNFGTDALTIEANGDVEGTSSFGIFALQGNYAESPVSITTAGTVTGGNFGIYARNDGTGALEIVANGDVAGAGVAGILAVKVNATIGPLSITTYGTVTGGQAGIIARNYGNSPLEIVANGDVAGTALTSSGIYARSDYDTGHIDITVGSGATASGGVTGVQFIGGAANTLNNHGSVRNLAGIGGVAIDGDVGNETVNNFGVVTGDVLLAEGANAFNNMAGGLFNSGVTVDLGVGNLLINEGTLSPGGAGTIMTTALTGDFSQPGSVFEVNLLGFQSDLLNVSGDTDLDGLVRPLFTLNGLGAARRWTILNSGTDIVDNGIGAVSTPVVQFGLDFPSPTQMDLVLGEVDFVVSGLNKNETSIAKNLNKVFAAGNFPKLDAAMTAIAQLPSEAAIANALDQLSPEIYLDTEIATLFSAANFANSLMSCPVRDGAAAFIKEGECVWARLSGRSFEQDRTFQTLGFDERSFEVAGGLQGALGDVWRVGFAGAYEKSFLDSSTFASSDADRLHGGATLKSNPGALLLAGAVSGGYGWYETERQIAFPGFSALAQADHEISYLNGRFRAAYLFSAGSWYAKPIVDFDATHVSLDGVNEKGGAGVGLNVRGQDETVLSASPALELGAQFGAPYGTLVRPYLRGGATFYDDPDFVLLASFEGAPSGIGPFRIATATDDVLANIGAGVDVIGAEGASFRLYYEGRFGDTVEQHAGGIKANLPF